MEVFGNLDEAIITHSKKIKRFLGFSSYSAKLIKNSRN